MTDSTDRLARVAGAERRALVAFARARVGDAAEDVVQESLLRAAHAAPDVPTDDAMRRWLWRVVRNAVVDAHRRRAAAAPRREAYAAHVHAEARVPDEPDGRPCACLPALVPALTPAYAEVVAAELAGEPAAALAGRLGITSGTLKVRRHRAHRQLRRRAEATCGACAARGCQNCSCPPPALP